MYKKTTENRLKRGKSQIYTHSIKRNADMMLYGHKQASVYM